MSVNLRRQTKTCLFWAQFKTQRLPPGRWSACNQALDAVWHIWACFADHTCVSKKPQSGKRVPSGVKIPNVNTDLWPFLSFYHYIYIYVAQVYSFGDHFLRKIRIQRYSARLSGAMPRLLAHPWESSSFTPTLGVTMPSRTSCITKPLRSLIKGPQSIHTLVACLKIQGPL